MMEGYLYTLQATDNVGIATYTHNESRPSPSGAISSEEMVRAWIDPVILALVVRLFSPPGMAFFARLCAEAIQPSLFPASLVEQHAQISVASVTSLCKLPGWKWKRETTLKMLQVFESLTVLMRKRRKQATIIEIPLGKRTKIPTREELLANLDDCYARKHNKKTRQLVVRVRAQLLRYGVPSYEEACALLGIDQDALDRLHDTLLAHLQSAGIPEEVCARIMLGFDQDALPILISHRQAVIAASAEDHSEAVSGRTPEGISHVVQGSVFATQENPGSIEPARCLSQTGPSGPLASSTRTPVLSDLECDVSQAVDCPQSDADSEDLFLDVDVSHRKLVFASEGELQAEAARYMQLVDGKRGTIGKWVKGVVNGYKKRIQVTPVRAAVSLINTLLRMHCPIVGVESKQRVPRMRFYRSYNLYGDALDPLPVSDEIKEWLASPYSYEEIATALAAWGKLHEQDLWDQRPSVANVVAAGLLKGPEEEDTLFDGDHLDDQDTCSELDRLEYPEPDAPWTGETCMRLFSFYAGHPLTDDLFTRLWLEAEQLVGVHARYRVETCIEYLVEAEPTGAYAEIGSDGSLYLSLQALGTLSASPDSLIALIDHFMPESYQYFLACLATGKGRFPVADYMEIEGEIVSREEYLKLCWNAYDVVWAERYSDTQAQGAGDGTDAEPQAEEETNQCVEDPQKDEISLASEQEETMHVLTALRWTHIIKKLASPLGYYTELQMLPDYRQGMIYVEERANTTNHCLCKTEGQVRALVGAFEREVREREAGDIVENRNYQNVI